MSVADGKGGPGQCGAPSLTCAGWSRRHNEQSNSDSHAVCTTPGALALRSTPHPLPPLSFVSPMLHPSLRCGLMVSSMNSTYVAPCQRGGPSLTGGHWLWQKCKTRCNSHALCTLAISWNSMPRGAHPMSFVSPMLHPFLRRGVVADGSSPSIR